MLEKIVFCWLVIYVVIGRNREGRSDGKRRKDA
jgi:hypothetical protein